MTIEVKAAGDESQNLTKLKISDEETKDSSDNCQLKSKNKSNIPDGGWGWVVLLSALFIRIIITGIYVSFALYTKDFINEFKTSPSIMSWMISTYSSISLLVAPLAGYLATKFGYRIVSMVGLLVAGIAYPSTYFYPTLWFTFLTASFIVPFAQGLCYMCTNVILTTYFEKRLPIAMGVFSCGSGISSFAVTPLMTLIIDRFGWKLSKVIYSLFYIIAVLCSLTFRPVNLKANDKNKENEEIEIQNESVPVDQIVSVFGSKDSNIFNYISMANIASKTSVNDESSKYYNSLRSLRLSKKEIDKNSVNVVNVPISSLVGISVASNLQIKAAIEQTTSEKNIELISKDAPIIVNVKKSCGYVKLLKKPIFLLFLFSNLLSNLGYDTPYLYVKSKALERNVSDTKATWLLTSLGIGNIFGRLGFGILGARKVNSYLMNSFCLILAGSFILMSRVAFFYPLMVIYTVGFGIFMGGYVTLGPVLLVQILDISDFSNGLGMLFIVQAIGFLCGAPISGLIYDETKSFDWPFMSCGLIILSSGLILLLAFCSRKFRKSQKK